VENQKFKKNKRVWEKIKKEKYEKRRKKNTKMKVKI
jgi:hypothetical protein